MRTGEFYQWLSDFELKHPGTRKVEHAFTGSNRQRRRSFGMGVRGFAVSRLGQKRRYR